MSVTILVCRGGLGYAVLVRESYICEPLRNPKSSAELAGDMGLPVRGRMSPKMIIGRREWLNLPELGVDVISAKIDTGAYTSSLHAEDIEAFTRGGADWVSFVTHNHYGHKICCEVPVVQRKKIKSSTGNGRMRYIISTTVKAISGMEWSLLLSLADRSVMKCPLLLGRRALSGFFVVDTQASHLFGNIKNMKGRPHHKRS